MNFVLSFGREVGALETATPSEPIAAAEKVAAIAAEDQLRARVEALESEKDGVYRERNKTVAGLAVLAMRLGCKVGMARHPESDENWDRDWMNIVFIDLPTGQVSWHIHDSEMRIFAFLPTYELAWDGHTTEEKYRRVAALAGDGREAK